MGLVLYTQVIPTVLIWHPYLLHQSL